MSTTKRLTLENLKITDEREVDAFIDQLFSAGLERVKAESEELRRRGILDAEGNLIRAELPPDMREGGDGDFGG